MKNFTRITLGFSAVLALAIPQEAKTMDFVASNFIYVPGMLPISRGVATSISLGYNIANITSKTITAGLTYLPVMADSVTSGYNITSQTVATGLTYLPSQQTTINTVKAGLAHLPSKQAIVTNPTVRSVTSMVARNPSYAVGAFAILLLFPSSLYSATGTAVTLGLSSAAVAGATYAAPKLIHKAIADFQAAAQRNNPAGPDPFDPILPTLTDRVLVPMVLSEDEQRDLVEAQRLANPTAVQKAIANPTIPNNPNILRAQPIVGAKISKYVSTNRNRLLYNGIVVPGLTMAGIAAVGTVISISVSRGMQLLWDLIGFNILGKPSFILEASARNRFTLAMDSVKNQIFMPEPVTMIFNKQLEENLSLITLATRNINSKILAGKKNVKYRNLMLWGPPGTGKTMFAKKIAKESGMAWAMMSGATFSRFNEIDGIKALDDLFAWAKTAKGLVIFIDEAESFLSKRENMDPNSTAYKMLTNFLNYTGERSDRFMFVFATNHKDVIDSAMYRRIDDLVYVPLPGLEERIQVLGLYRDKVLLDETQNELEFVESAQRELPDRKIIQIAHLTDGLSNGDLEGIINSIRTDADTTQSGLISQEIIDRVVERAVNKLAAFSGKNKGELA